MGEVVDMKIRLIVLACIFSSTITSCFYYGKTTIRKFRLCYENIYTGIDTLIKIDGFYDMNISFCEDKSWNNGKVVFYSNGMFLENPQLENIKEFNLNIETIGKWWNWGVYRLSNDTIIGQTLHIDGATSSCESVYYKIIDSCTIQRIHPVDRSNYYINETYDYRPLYFYKFSYSKAHFVPFDSLPNPDVSKAKSKKWFWCDKKEYKKWKKSI